MKKWHNLGLVSSATLIALSVFAGCGGRSDEDDAKGGSAGEGSGGAGAGQGGMPGATGGRSFGGSSSGGATMGKGGSGQGGNAGDGCVYAGRAYKKGESFKGSDDCNTCTCYGNNEVGCTLIECPNVCPSIQGEYALALEEAKQCDPTLRIQQCTALDAGDPNCRCPTFVNPSNSAREELAQLLTSYDDNQCASGIICAACAEPARGYCTPQGRCADLYAGAGASCQVNGKVYPDGATGIKDPFSCNSCSCLDGSLACTERGCEEPCPPNSAPAQRCLLCGPADDCQLMETACLPLCSDTSSCDGAGESCVDGVCRLRCG